MKEFFNYTIFYYNRNHIITTKNVLGIIIVILIAFGIVKSIRFFIKKHLKTNPKSEGRINSFFQIIKYTLWTIATFACLKLLTLDFGFLFLSSTAILIVLSLGLQSVFADFISGILILFDGTIEVNDIIEVDGNLGKVKKITLRNTTVITRDDYTIIIPNKKFVTENVTNWSHHNNIMRFHVKVGVAYGSDTKLVSKLLMECAETHSLINNSRKGFVSFKSFGDSSLNFELYFWTTETFRIEILKSDLRFMIDKAFRENGITIPFPQRDLHIVQPTKENLNTALENN